MGVELPRGCLQGGGGVYAWAKMLFVSVGPKLPPSQQCF